MTWPDFGLRPTPARLSTCTGGNGFGSGRQSPTGTTPEDTRSSPAKNGRRFANPGFARRYAAVGLSDIMAGIPVYAPEPGLHDFIVQAAGAFDETIHGILNLASLGQAVEVRVVVQRHTVPVLAGLATLDRNMTAVRRRSQLPDGLKWRRIWLA